MDFRQHTAKDRILTMTEETPVDRAKRILQESIAFRTSVIPEIHKEIHAMVWDAYQNHCYHQQVYGSRVKHRTLMAKDSAGFMCQPGGHRYYTGTIDKVD
jgi:hypothetical protein